MFMPEFANFTYGTLYATCPDNTMLRTGDNHFPGAGVWERKYLSMLASRHRNPHAQWYVNHMTKPMGGNEAWYDILWYDPAVPEMPPDALPLSRHFQATGVAVIRTGWYEPDATVVSFKCGDLFYESGHGHLDQNSFTIYRGGHPALDSGGYDFHATTHYCNYYERTVADDHRVDRRDDIEPVLARTQRAGRIGVVLPVYPTSRRTGRRPFSGRNAVPVPGVHPERQTVSGIHGSRREAFVEKFAVNDLLAIPCAVLRDKLAKLRPVARGQISSVRDVGIPRAIPTRPGRGSCARRPARRWCRRPAGRAPRSGPSPAA
ncbi:MAG: heparinase II/III family protein, partial [Kiritimatiellae bacterium]|nr:heparinase II/III family protein [Kiritimatiellia bacterium]